MPSRFFGIRRNDMIKASSCPRASLLSSSDLTSKGSKRQLCCPNCVLPIVVGFIFVFTVAQLVLIHRTITSYKTRHRAFEESYGTGEAAHSINTNDSKVQVDLAFSRKFASTFQHSHVFWSSGQSYPYRLPGMRHPPINHLWKTVCSKTPSTLRGNVSIDVEKEISLQDLAKELDQVEVGGKWAPRMCRARYNVAIIIPYRFRWRHLKTLLSVLHPHIQRQQISYQIFVAEQQGNFTFNKGVLMNAAFLLAMNGSDNSFDCVIFHDVDLLPENDRNIYGCDGSPAHLSVAIDAYSYRLPYTSLVGGVFAISTDQFVTVNGYSNLYWGWGAEDDDMYHRVMANHLFVNRPGTTIARYKMLQHSHRRPNRFISPLMRTARVRFKQDGLTSCRFRLLSAFSKPLYTHFLIDVGQPNSIDINQTSTKPPTFTPAKTKPDDDDILLDLPRDGVVQEYEAKENAQDGTDLTGSSPAL